MTFFVDLAESDLTCMDSSNETPIKLTTNDDFLFMEMHLNTTLTGLRLIHLISFLLLMTGTIIESQGLNS